jgi:PII-like signaling protein
MKTDSNALRLRIYISNADKFRHTLLSETLVFAAKRYGLAGATVLRGSMGYGSSSVIHSSKFWEITEKLPVVIEMVDDAEKIEQFLDLVRPWFDRIPTGCLMTTEKVQVVLFRKGNKKT